MGYKLAGCDVLGNLEIDTKMNDIYIKNHNPKYNFCMDIREFNKLENLPAELYNLDILDGSPPCTTFSTAGQREKVWGKKKKFREGQVEQILDDLSFVFIETVRKLQPKLVIMENVEGLLLGNAWHYVQEIYKRFDEAGYNSKHFLLKAELMGVPQARHRVFFIAVNKKLKFDIELLDMHFNYAPVLFKDVRSEKGKEIKGKLTKERVNNIKKGDMLISDITARLENGRKTGFNDTLTWDENVAPTLRASGTSVRVCDKTYYSDDDVISIQTFPRDFDFMGMSTNYICGMSVPPVMMKRVVTRVIESGVFNKC